MSSGYSYSAKIRPVDTAMEWFLKGANIGELHTALYFGVCLAKAENPRKGLSTPAYALTLAGYVAKQMLIVGGTIGTT